MRSHGSITRQADCAAASRRKYAWSGRASRQRRVAVGTLALAAAGTLLLGGCGGGGDSAPTLVQKGQKVFRYDTFGDEATWTGKLQLNKVIESAVNPMVAASVGVKIDVDALPASVIDGIRNGSVNLNDPQTTLALLSLNAVVGLQGQVSKNFDGSMTLTQVGITCALCHSTVSKDVTVTASGNPTVPDGTVLIPTGIVGHRLDGWPNRDLNPGAIVALSPAVAGTPQAAVFNSWGPGRYDARFNMFLNTTDPLTGGQRGIATFAVSDASTSPDGTTRTYDPFAVLIPPAYGLAGIDREIYTGDGDRAHEPVGAVAYWNRYVSVTQMGGIGTFDDPRLDEMGMVPVDHITDGTDVDKLLDQVTSALPALQAYQLSIRAPAPPAGAFDAAAAARGQIVFNGQGTCATCHSGAQLTDANETLHPRSASVANDTSYVLLSATQQWRTSPLPGIWQHPPYFHDGSAATLAAVVSRYNTKLDLGLTPAQQSDLVAYLESL